MGWHPRPWDTCALSLFPVASDLSLVVWGAAKLIPPCCQFRGGTAVDFVHSLDLLGIAFATSRCSCVCLRDLFVQANCSANRSTM